MHTRSRSLLVPSAAAAVAFVALLGHAAPAGAHEPSGTGYDVGFRSAAERCRRRPASGSSASTVVASSSQTRASKHSSSGRATPWYGSPAFYANTGNPGPAYSPFWPIGQTSPRVCDAGAPNSSNCSFDYGWNGAKDSFANAVRAIAHVDGVVRGHRAATRREAKWWLDVEILNSWQTLEAAYGPSSASKWNDVYALTGAVRALWDAGVAVVGIYSTQYQWNAITGGSDYTHDGSRRTPSGSRVTRKHTAPGAAARRVSRAGAW